MWLSFHWGFPGGSDSKESACNEGDWFDPWVGKISWRRAQQRAAVFLPGEFDGQLTDMGNKRLITKGDREGKRGK